MTRMSIIAPPDEKEKDPRENGLNSTENELVHETIEDLSSQSQHNSRKTNGCPCPCPWLSRRRSRHTSDDDSSDDSDGDRSKRWRNYCMLAVMLLVNLLNYVDRYTLAGILQDVQEYYSLSDTNTGLLQTSFIVFYMLFSPLFGYLGDRVNRKWLMAAGILFWSAVTLAGSFVPPHLYPVFLMLRALVGIGEASYSTIAPTIIADLFVKDARTKALAVFYFAIPVGSGLGYIIGASVAKAMGEWQWALRVTPPFGVLCVVLILLVLRETPRGAAEGGTDIAKTSWFEDLKAIMKIKSFLLSTAGFTCVAFVAGALALWAPLFLEYSIMVQTGETMEDIGASVSFKFGVITCIAGFLGVFIGTEAGRRLRKVKQSADPLVCAVGLISSAPFFFLAIFVSDYNTTATFVFIFLAETLLCLNWALVTDMLLYVIIPTRRSSAEAVQILISHALGDAGSPYIIGIISDSLRRRSGNTGSTLEKFVSLQSALYISCFVCVLGGLFFLASALYIDRDRAAVDAVTRGCRSIEGKDSASSMINPIEAGGGDGGGDGGGGSGNRTDSSDDSCLRDLTDPTPQHALLA